MSTANIPNLTSSEQLDQFINSPGRRILFKHSTTCPISAAAYREFQSYMQEHDTPAAVILVIEDRPVSNEVAERFGIKHESPQIFLLEDGKVLWNTSHWKITSKAIEEEMNR